MSNKVNVKNPKNEKFDFYKKKVESLLSKAASNLFRDKYFHEEFKGVFLLSFALKIVSSLISFCTGVLAVHIATRLFFGHYPSLFFAVAVGACLEGIKSFLWSINSKWTLKYKQISKMLVFSLVLLHLVSLGASAYGGFMLPTFADGIKIKTPVLVQNSSDLTALYSSLGVINKEIANNSAEVEKTASNSTKRSLSKTLSLLLEQRTAKEKEIFKIKEIQRLDNKAAKNKQDSQNEQLRLDRKEEILTAQISCLIASVFFELLFIICSCFRAYYLFRYSIDHEDESETVNLPKLNSNHSSDQKLPSIQHGQKAPEFLVDETASKPAKIGFHRRCIDSEKAPVVNCALSACENTFEKKVHNKKYCCDSCRQLDYQIRLHDKQTGSTGYYVCSVAHTKKTDDFLVFLECEELDLDGKYQVVKLLTLAKEYNRDRSTDHWLYLEKETLDFLAVNNRVENNSDNLRELGIKWKGYNLVKNSKTSKS